MCNFKREKWRPDRHLLERRTTMWLSSVLCNHSSVDVQYIVLHLMHEFIWSVSCFMFAVFLTWCWRSIHHLITCYLTVSVCITYFCIHNFKWLLIANDCTEVCSREARKSAVLQTHSAGSLQLVDCLVAAAGAGGVACLTLLTSAQFSGPKVLLRFRSPN